MYFCVKHNSGSYGSGVKMFAYLVRKVYFAEFRKARCYCGGKSAAICAVHLLEWRNFRPAKNAAAAEIPTKAYLSLSCVMYQLTLVS